MKKGTFQEGKKFALNMDLNSVSDGSNQLLFFSCAVLCFNSWLARAHENNLKYT